MSDAVTTIISAYLSKNTVAPESIPDIMRDIAGALVDIEAGNLSGEVAPVELKPAISIKKSVTPDAVYCLECGEGHKSLKRHLATKHNLTPAEYRARWGLSHDYPMVSPSYSASRSELAKKMGLGATSRAPKAVTTTKKGGK
jgi:predicted transcriptional regulator